MIFRIIRYTDKEEKADLIFPHKWGTGFLRANLIDFISIYKFGKCKVMRISKVGVDRNGSNHDKLPHQVVSERLFRGTGCGRRREATLQTDAK